MPDALDEQIEAYRALLPDIKHKFGSVWALVVNRELISTFHEFALAAEYAVAHHGADQVLIRHTDERLESVPFIQIED